MPARTNRTANHIECNKAHADQRFDALAALGYGGTSALSAPLTYIAPNLQVGIEVPVIKATLADQEFQLITSIAGDNLGEPPSVPAAALWMENYYLGTDADDEQDG